MRRHEVGWVVSGRVAMNDGGGGVTAAVKVPVDCRNFTSSCQCGREEQRVEVMRLHAEMTRGATKITSAIESRPRELFRRPQHGE